MSDEVENTPVEEAPVEETPAEEPKETPAEEPKADAPKSCGGKCNLDFEHAFEVLKAPFTKVEAYSEVHDIFHWTNLINSAIAFVCLNVVATLVLRYKYNLFTVLFLLAFFAILAALIFDIKRVIAYFKGESAESLLKDVKVPEYESYLQGFFKFMGGIVKAIIDAVGEVVLVRDVLLTVLFIPGSLILAFVFQKLDVFCIAYLLALFFFIWCPLYDRFPEQIDKALAAIKEGISKAIQSAKDASNKPKAE